MSSIILGGVTVKFTVKNCCCDLYFLLTKQHHDFFLDSNLKKKSMEAICVNFSALHNNVFHKTEEVIFLNHQSSFSKKDDGTYQLLYFSEKEDILLWCLDIDSEFSRFDYKISQKNGNSSDPYDLSFHRFLLQHTFINYHGLIIHAAGGSIYGKGMVFPAVSGTGKSTLSHLLLPIPENQLFSEERIIMRRLDDGWHLWGTPWKGTGSIARNESESLSALVFLSQAPETKITPLSTSAALRRLLETVSIPWYSQEWTDKGLAVCESLLRDIPAFELAFRPDETAVQAVADFAASLP